MQQQSRHEIDVFKIAGVQVSLDYSWAILFAIVLWSLAAGYFPYAYPGYTQSSYWIVGLAATVMFFASVRSEERRVGKECRYRWWPYHETTKGRKGVSQAYAEGRGRRGRGDGGGAAPQRHVSGPARDGSQGAGSHLGQDAHALHPDPAGGQGHRGAIALRPDPRADHLSL